jgi:hypothetical protein
MSTRASALLAWSLAGLSLAMFVASITLWVLARSARLPGDLEASVTPIDMLVSVPVLAFPVVGALIASKRSHNPIGWICLAEGILWAFLGMIESYGLYGLARPGSVPFPVAVYALGEWLWVPTVGLVAIYLPLLFPDGRLLSRRWLSVAVLGGIGTSGFVISGALVDTIPVNEVPGRGIANPIGIEGLGKLEDLPIFSAVEGLFLLAALGAVASVVVRFRRSRGVERQQMKWFAYVIVVLIGGSVLTGGLSDLTGVGWLGKVSFVLSMMGLMFLPIAVGIAILRYRLYEIDLIINRTLVYGPLTATLALMYFGGVATAQLVLRALTGQLQQPQLAIVASTLIIAALFNPLRRRIQSFIDRRFYRSKYDARKTLEAFTAKLRDETDLQALSGELTRVVGETMQPAHVSLWLSPDTSVKGSSAGASLQ